MLIKQRVFVVSVLVIAAVLLSGCTSQFYEYVKVESSGTSLIIADTEKPVKLDVLGNGNTIKINKDVVLTKISVTFGFQNNTFLLYGSAADDKTSTWNNHNCTLDLGDTSNTIQYYTD